MGRKISTAIYGIGITVSAAPNFPTRMLLMQSRSIPGWYSYSLGSMIMWNGGLWVWWSTPRDAETLVTASDDYTLKIWRSRHRVRQLKLSTSEFPVGIEFRRRRGSRFSYWPLLAFNHTLISGQWEISISFCVSHTASLKSCAFFSQVVTQILLCICFF